MYKVGFIAGRVGYSVGFQEYEYLGISGRDQSKVQRLLLNATLVL